MATLIVREGPSAGERIELGDELILGRISTDVLKSDAEVSRRHAAVRTEGDRITVEDLGSANGTFVNEKRIEGSTELSNGDVVRVGQSSFEVQIEGAVAGTVVRGAPPTRVGPAPTPAAAPPSSSPPPSPPPPPSAAPPPAASAAPPAFGAPQPGYGAPPPGYPTPSRGVPSWVWYAIGGGVLVIALVLVLVFALGGGVEGDYRCTATNGRTATLTLADGQATLVNDSGETVTAVYVVEGDVLTITLEGAPPDNLTIDGDRLTGSGITCDKL